MITFHCSAAAAAHLDGNRRGSDSIFEPSGDGGCLSEQALGDILRWVVHAVKIGRSTCLIAMEVETRWVHVIHQVRLGDIRGFVERLCTRFINGMEWAETDLAVLTRSEMENAVDHYLGRHSELRFYRGTDRSVMGHIAQVSSEYQYVWRNVGAFPEDEETGLAFDLRLNDTLLSRSGSNEYWNPTEAMMTHWLRGYAGKRDADVMAACKALREARRGLTVASEYRRSGEPHAGEPAGIDNVVDLRLARKRRLH
ncbi:DUF6933 domain-containing protein [Serratia marcescens]|uniref:DUF6933 domain-containing protein n=1 Tax=Serratia marcescens TaxID=615 RepID=UPI0013DBFCC4|nr:hypothetical protein [Serratia marcescens]